MVLAWRAQRTGRQHEWTLAFALTAASAILGTAYHAGLRGQHVVRYPLWSVIIVCLAVALSFMLAGTVNLFLSARLVRLLFVARLFALAAFVGCALAGHASLTVLVATEAIVMIAIVALWVRGCLVRYPGAQYVMGAFLASAAAALVFAGSLRFTLGWVVTSTALYHVAQIPGLVLLYLGVAPGPS